MSRSKAPGHDQPIYNLQPITPQRNRVIRTYAELHDMAVIVSRGAWKIYGPHVMEAKGFYRQWDDDKNKRVDDLADAIAIEVWQHNRWGDSGLKPIDRGFAKRQCRNAAINLVRLRVLDTVRTDPETGKRLIPDRVHLDDPVGRAAQPGEAGTDEPTDYLERGDTPRTKLDIIRDRKGFNPEKAVIDNEFDLISRTGRNYVGNIVPGVKPLSEKVREALEFNVDGMKRPEIAKEQGVSVSTVRDRLREGKDTIRLIMRPPEKPPASR